MPAMRRRVGVELLGGDGEEEAEGAAVGRRALGGIEGDGLDDGNRSGSARRGF